MRGANPGSLQSKNRKVENGISSETNVEHASFSSGTSTVSGYSAAARPPIDPGPLPSAQKKFGSHWQQKKSVHPFFKFPQTLKKSAVIDKTEISALQRVISTGSRSRRNPKVLPFDPHGESRHFHVFDGHVTFCPKPIIQKIQKMFPVKYRTKRAALNPSSIRHREPSQNYYP